MPVLRLKTPVMPSWDQSPLGSCILLERSKTKKKRRANGERLIRHLPVNSDVAAITLSCVVIVGVVPIFTTYFYTATSVLIARFGEKVKLPATGAESGSDLYKRYSLQQLGKSPARNDKQDRIGKGGNSDTSTVTRASQQTGEDSVQKNKNRNGSRRRKKSHTLKKKHSRTHDRATVYIAAGTMALSAFPMSSQDWCSRTKSTTPTRTIVLPTVVFTAEYKNALHRTRRNGTYRTEPTRTQTEPNGTDPNRAT